MRAKSFFKATCLVVCLGIFLLSVPPLSSAQRPGKFDFRTMIRKPVLLISSYLPIFSSVFDLGASDTPSHDTIGTVRPLGDIIHVRPSDGD